jgi:hypothetical protein
MKYIITEHQYRLLTEQEEEILSIPFAAFNNDWDDLQLFLERRGNPLYEITDDLDLSYANVKSLGNLTSVGGNLDLYNCTNLTSLGNLTSVGGYLDLRHTYIKSLGNLTSVEGSLFMYGSEIESLGNLTSVGGDLGLTDSSIEDLGNLTSVGGDLYLEITPLSEKYTEEEIRSMVEVGGEIYL